ncbi:MAG TPA: AbrB/MazE/SpoVT family DNA-binding domain-containing protein [Longimicrobiaceae bacterium]|nr:AbrB/MazE/SpoVT family DNA-binding domain-containing protein [Longimicrobiaceae bacterium]
MKVSERGQVTIPLEMRERFGFLPDTEVEFVATDGALQIRKKANRTRSAIAEIYGRRRFSASTDDLMKLLRE